MSARSITLSSTPSRVGSPYSSRLNPSTWRIVPIGRLSRSPPNKSHHSSLHVQSNLKAQKSWKKTPYPLPKTTVRTPESPPNAKAKRTLASAPTALARPSFPRLLISLSTEREGWSRMDPTRPESRLDETEGWRPGPQPSPGGNDNKGYKEPRQDRRQFPAA